MGSENYFFIQNSLPNQTIRQVRGKKHFQEFKDSHFTLHPFFPQKLLADVPTQNKSGKITQDPGNKGKMQKEEKRAQKDNARKSSQNGTVDCRFVSPQTRPSGGRAFGRCLSLDGP